MTGRQAGELRSFCDEALNGPTHISDGTVD